MAFDGDIGKYRDYGNNRAPVPRKMSMRARMLIALIIGGGGLTFERTIDAVLFPQARPPVERRLGEIDVFAELMKEIACMRPSPDSRTVHCYGGEL
jgi:hypothetical protein